MKNKRFHNSLVIALLFLVLIFVFEGCKSKRKARKEKEQQAVVVVDTTNDRCRLNFKSSKTLIKHIHESEFNFD